MEKKKVVAIIQAHMSSSRLPGKVMLDLCGEPVLYRMIERVRYAKHVDEIVVAVSTMECDDQLIEACEKWGVSTFRGSNNDVLERFYRACQAYPAETYVRLTSDCPAIDFQGLDEMIEFYWSHDYRYVATGAPGSVSGCWSYEVFGADLMEENYQNATEGYEHEHVTPYMYTRQPSWTRPANRFDGRGYIVCIDTPADYAVVKDLFAALYRAGDPFTTEEVVAYLDARPDLSKSNQNEFRKSYKDFSYDDLNH